MTIRKRPISLRPRPAAQPESTARPDPEASPTAPPGQLDERPRPANDRDETGSRPIGDSPSARPTFEVDVASIFDEDWWDMHADGGEGTDYETFEEARDAAVEMLEGVVRAATIIRDHLNEADRFEDLEPGWREVLITRVAPPA